MRDWIEFWNKDQSVYVNATHKRLHAAGIARDIIANLPSSAAAVLDYGCGEALYAEQVAGHCRELVLCDAAERIRTRLRQRLATTPAIRIVAPEEAQSLPPASFDLIVANSLVQYLSRDQLRGLLTLWRTLLRPNGRLIVADVIPHGQSPFADAGALLRFGARGGFLFPAVLGLGRMALSDYRKVRTRHGLTTYAEPDMLELLRACGFEATRTHPNFGHNQSRMTFSARPTARETAAAR